jgi:hypothetical protein
VKRKLGSQLEIAYNLMIRKFGINDTGNLKSKTGGRVEIGYRLLKTDRCIALC